MPLTAAALAKHLDGEVLGNPDLILTGFAPANHAQAGDLTFAENETYFNLAEKSAAVAILVDKPFTSATKTVIKVASARIAFAKVLPLFHPEPTFAPGVHPTAVVAPTAQVDPSAHIGPHCVVEDHVQIGARVVLQGGNHIGAKSRLGDDTRLFPNVVVYAQTQIGQRVRIHGGTVIGADGFGYVLDGSFHRKIPQVGFVIIQDDVELGANVTVDRGALGPTVIGKGTKIDNLVQVAHNVTLGEHCLIVAQVGIAGSTKVGSYTTIAGQVGLAGHLKIGSKVIVAGQSGVMHDIPDGQNWMGSPAQPDRKAKRQLIALTQLPDLIHRVSEIEKQLPPTKPAPPSPGSPKP